MTTTTAMIYETAQNIITAITDKKAASVEIISNKMGSVIINTVTQDFTYIDKFGNDVLNLVLKTKCINNMPQKIACLAAIMVGYRDTGGFVFLTTNK